MVQNSEDERNRKSAGYASQDVPCTEASQEISAKEPVHSPGLHEASVVREFLEEERAARLAALRAEKARLLEAKARAIKLAEAKQHEANIACLEDGKQRGLKGFALVEHAARLADMKKQQNGKLEEANRDQVGALVAHSHSQDDSKEEAGANATASHTQEDIKEQLPESFRRREDAKFVSSRPEKIKNVNRKGHHGRGSMQSYYATVRA